MSSLFFISPQVARHIMKHVDMVPFSQVIILLLNKTSGRRMIWELAWMVLDHWVSRITRKDADQITQGLQHHPHWAIWSVTARSEAVKILFHADGLSSAVPRIEVDTSSERIVSSHLRHVNTTTCYRHTICAQTGISSNRLIITTPGTNTFLLPEGVVEDI